MTINRIRDLTFEKPHGYCRGTSALAGRFNTFTFAGPYLCVLPCGCGIRQTAGKAFRKSHHQDGEFEAKVNSIKELIIFLFLFVLYASFSRGQITASTCLAGDSLKGAGVTSSVGTINWKACGQNFMCMDEKPQGNRTPRTLVPDPNPKALTAVSVYGDGNPYPCSESVEFISSSVPAVDRQMGLKSKRTTCTA